MGRSLWGVLVASLLWAAVAGAQSFNGERSRRTEPFLLDPGTTVFRIDHIGEGRFQVDLLDGEGTPVHQRVSAEGPFSGTQAVQVDRGGRYRFQVTAGGAWSIQRRVGTEGGTVAGPDPAAAGRAAGMAAAEAGWSWGWFSRGLVGGTLGGPIGTGLVLARAGRSTVDPVTAPAGDHDPRFVAGYRLAVENRIRSRRREAAAVGGLIGTGVFIYAILQLVDIEIGGSAGGGRQPTPPPPT